MMPREPFPAFEGIISTGFEQRLEGLLRQARRASQLARDCRGAGQWQDHGHWRSRRDHGAFPRLAGRSELSDPGGDRCEK